MTTQEDVEYRGLKHYPMTILQDSRTGKYVGYKGYNGELTENKLVKPPVTDYQDKEAEAGVVTIAVQHRTTMAAFAVTDDTTVNVTDENNDADTGDELILLMQCNGSTHEVTMGDRLSGESFTLTADKVNALRFVYDGTLFRQVSNLIIS